MSDVGVVQILGEAERSKCGHRRVNCKCYCGKLFTCFWYHLNTGHTNSCGCLRNARVRESLTTHGMHTSREYKSWAAAKDRCFNEKHPHYSDYGGRGITMCDEWRDSFEAFFRDMGKCPEGLTIDRRDNSGGYNLGNCRWATRTEQGNNRRNNVLLRVGNEVLTRSQLAERLGVSYQLIKYHMEKGKTVQEVVDFFAKKRA